MIGQSILRDCFVAPVPEIFEAAILLNEAVECHLVGDNVRAAKCLREADNPIIGKWIDGIWLGDVPSIHAVRKVDGLPPILAKEARFTPRNAPLAMRRALVARDGHHCRLCSIPLVRPEVRKELVRLYPNEARWTSNRAADQHRGLQVMWLQYDHIIVHSRGGETSEDNLVVTCAACNFGRAGYMLEEVGIRDPREFVRAPSWYSRIEWDGLERLLPPGKRFQQDPCSSFRAI